MARKKASEAAVTFEAAMLELEEIVQSLEKGDLPLDEAVALFEQGVRLSRLCAGKLDVAQEKVRRILVEKDGELIPLPFAEMEE